jgi:alpha-N-arabinofuranosidase
VQRILVLPQEEIGTINPFLHGQFAEHLGELVYPGIWVGTDSKIPNTGGIRNDVLEALRPLQISVLRWPGGCFADSYHWRDGIGPREERPKRINVHWGMAEEPNHFGTHEFLAFCRALGAEPYLAGNVGSGSPAELRAWVEYCNFAGDSALANERRANGQQEPFGVRFWGVGNENWGCGGNMTPDEYAGIYARFRTFIHNYSGTKIESIACGPNEWDWRWTERFLTTLTDHRRSPIMGLAAHYYCWTAGNATQYTESQWLELLSKAAAMEGIVTGHRAIMDRFDPERRIKLIVDEWGAWHPVEAGKPSGGLYQQNTIRDACVAALTLDIFHNHADKLYMANIAQMINVLQALLLVEDDQCIKTPTYHIFDLYRPHKSATAVRLVTMAETVSDGESSAEHCRRCYPDKQPFSLRAIQGSASVKDGILCVTAVNAHPTQPVDLEVTVGQGQLETVEVVTLATGDIHDHNTFETPDKVTLSAPVTVQACGGQVRIPMPAASVIRLQGRLH